MYRPFRFNKRKCFCFYSLRGVLLMIVTLTFKILFPSNSVYLHLQRDVSHCHLTLIKKKHLSIIRVIQVPKLYLHPLIKLAAVSKLDQNAFTNPCENIMSPGVQKIVSCSDWKYRSLFFSVAYALETTTRLS